MSGEDVQADLVLIGPWIFRNGLNHFTKNVSSASFHDLETGRLVQQGIKVRELITLDAPIIVVAVG